MSALRAETSTEVTRASFPKSSWRSLILNTRLLQKKRLEKNETARADLDGLNRLPLQADPLSTFFLTQIPTKSFGHSGEKQTDCLVKYQCIECTGQFLVYVVYCSRPWLVHGRRSHRGEGLKRLKGLKIGKVKVISDSGCSANTLFNGWLKCHCPMR